MAHLSKLVFPRVECTWIGRELQRRSKRTMLLDSNIGPHLGCLEPTCARCGPDLGRHYVAVWVDYLMDS